VNFRPSLKQQLGCWLNERWRLELLLRCPPVAHALGIHWQTLCNRHETVTMDRSTCGARSHWADSSPLTATRYFPSLGSRLLQHCLKEWPVAFESTPQVAPPENPELTVVVGVRGTKRMPQFRACLNSLRAQCGPQVEILVVEQSSTSEFKSLLPADVRYIYTPLTHPKMPFNRAWALNVGGVAAKGKFLVLHDADLVVPAMFAQRVVAILSSGVDAVRLPRFLFYLDEPSSVSIQESFSFTHLRYAERVVANNPTPVAISKEAYLRIGGHDESFYGWGAEDNEFRDRLQTLNFSEGAFAPIIHLWHPEAPNRCGDRNAGQLREVLQTPAKVRIKALTARGFGQMVPSVIWQETP